MAKGQKRSNREKKKPKTAPKKMAAAASAASGFALKVDGAASKRPGR